MRAHLTRSQQETIDLGRSFAAQLVPGDVVALVGTLGSGKTQFVRGICEHLGVADHVASPTFTLINEYHAEGSTVVHVDLYRIERQEELAELGIDEYFNNRCICLIEWAERMRGLLPERHYLVTMQFGAGDEDRVAEIGEVQGVGV